MYYTKEKTLDKLNISEADLLYWKSIGFIKYSGRTDKYDIDSVLQTRTMTIGLEKLLDSTTKLDLITKMDNQSKFIRHLFSHIQHDTLESINIHSVNDVSKYGQKHYNIDSWLATSSFAFAKGKADSANTWYNKTISNLENKIGKISEDLKTLIGKNQLNSFHNGFTKGKKQKLHFLKNKLAKYQSKSYLPTWFGQKHKNDPDMYRKSRIQLIVQGEEMKKGNRSIRIEYDKDGNYQLKIWKFRTPISIPSSHSKTFSLNEFNRQTARVSYNKKGKLILNITYSYIKPVPLESTSRSKGTVGIDIGPKEIAAVFVKNDGNPALEMHFPTGNLLDKRTEDTQNEISHILDKIIIQAKHLGFYSLTIENLKFKPDHSYKSRSLNRMLSKFPRTVFSDLIESKCARNGLKLIKINPAYTSVIGLFKYALVNGYDLSHDSKSKDLSAALVIGRRGLGFNDKAKLIIRANGSLVSIPIKSILSAAEHADSKFSWVNDNTKGNWSLWSKLKKLGYRTLGELTAQVTNNPSGPIFGLLGCESGSSGLVLDPGKIDILPSVA